MNDIKVSINCITYNQEEYIAEAIESFLMQKTTFKYEILIHDDASTDNTSNIIKSYSDKYPKVIKPIYQMENQYSQGIKVGMFNQDRAKGKYIAVCEGDDYWVDPSKLQKQYDYMEKHPDCSMCFHAAMIIDATRDKCVGVISPYDENRISSMEDILTKGGGFVPTNSMFYKKELMDNPPEYLKQSKVGDYPLQIYLSSVGHSYYLNEVMASYRMNVNNSWTVKNNNIERKISNYLNSISMLENFNRESSYVYKEIVNAAIHERQCYVYLISKDYNNFQQANAYTYFKKLKLNKKIKLILSAYYPNLYIKIAMFKQRKVNSEKRKMACNSNEE